MLNKTGQCILLLRLVVQRAQLSCKYNIYCPSGYTVLTSGYCCSTVGRSDGAWIFVPYIVISAAFHVNIQVLHCQTFKEKHVLPLSLSDFFPALECPC